VGVHVDEAWTDRQAVGVDHPSGRLATQVSEGNDPVALDADVALEPRVPGAGDHLSATNQHVEQPSPPRGAARPSAARRRRRAALARPPVSRASGPSGGPDWSLPRRLARFERAAGVAPAGGGLGPAS
jgi:hypothetical protein